VTTDGVGPERNPVANAVLATLPALGVRSAAAIERAQRIDPLADGLNRLVAKVTVPGALRGVLSGTWLGHPVHPFLVSTPIGCWTSVSILDALGQRRAAQTLVGAGVVSVVPTALTGLFDWVDTDGAERRVGFVHLAVNTVATSVYALSWLARRRQRHGLGVGLAVVGAGVASAGGWLGGHLAYAMGVGVDTNAFDAGPLDWTHLDVEVPEGQQPVRTAVGPTPLLVVRQPEGVKVIGDRCSHRGAPLSDGEIAHGCVTCPWHGSRFDLSSGAVRRGPAVVPQPTYQVREGANGIDVRRDEDRALRANTTHPE
jgi:nitrite reductase/ring-hydroxylating ferredoxin subunit/uncharacterized membrane protein